MIHQQWQSAIKTWDTTVEKVQDIVKNENALDDAFSLKVAQTHC